MSDVNNTTDVSWLSEAELAAWKRLVALFMLVPSAVDAQLRRDSGLNFFEYSILVALAETRALQMTTLAEMTGGSLSRLSHAVTRLERQGWVSRAVQVGEIRCTEATITEAGREILAAAAPGHVREVRRVVFDMLTPAQVGQMRDICSRVVDQACTGVERMLAEDAADQSRS